MSRLASVVSGGLLLLANVSAFAQPTSTRAPPSSVTLTGEEWACLGTRLENLLSSKFDNVRVPLSACGLGTGTRGPGASNPTAGVSNTPTSRDPRSLPAPTGPVVRSTTLTQAPLYLTKAQLACVQSLVSSVSQDADQVSTIDLLACKISG